MINYPTKIHEEYIKYAVDFAEKNKMNLYLKGSLANGAATKYSDIDLAVMENHPDVIEKFITSYGRLSMTNITERPQGILIILYENGLCIDMDIRDSLMASEYSESVRLVESKDVIISTQVLRNVDIRINSIPVRDEWYKLLRLFHRSLIKKLSKKDTESESILQEIKDELDMKSGDKIQWKNIYTNDIQTALIVIKTYYLIPNEIEMILLSLINDL
jgi:predicted nucleotidyltransferase